MNVIKLSKHIFKCEFDIGIPINIWMIKHGDDVYIVDTGVEKLVDTQIKVALALGDPKAILLTHGHSDHIGGAAKWLEHFNIPIYAHSKELKYINGEAPYPNLKILEETGVANIVQPLSTQTLESIPIKYYLTPGHSPGHVAYHHETDNVFLAGDLFITSNSDLHPPVRKFTVNMNENIDSGSIIDNIKPKMISSSHGQELLYSDQLYNKYVIWYRD